VVLTVGDFLQLAPPKGQYAFLSDVWRGVFADRDVLLETHWRHVRDKNLLGILQRLRTGTHTSADMKMLATSRSRSAPSHVMWLFSTSWTRLTTTQTSWDVCPGRRLSFRELVIDRCRFHQ